MSSYFFLRNKFNQWYICPFKVDGIIYNCCEQYMMAQKSELFEDWETHVKIMASENPKEVKDLGREVKGFNQKVWDLHKSYIVFKGNYHKFKQNEEIRNLLLDTKNLYLAETNKDDWTWSIGIDKKDAIDIPPHKYPGQNLLGITLMQVREVLKNEENKK